MAAGLQTPRVLKTADKSPKKRLTLPREDGTELATLLDEFRFKEEADDGK
jgi:hypothetical protein